MLWIYINNQGNVECQVNVGNLIRQGNRIPLFVVLEGQNTVPQTMIWRLADVGYLKPSAKEFIYLYEGNNPVQTEKTFQLNNPSQANSHFIGGQKYEGYEVWIPADATNFPANGGHVGLSFLMKDVDNRGVFADSIAVYVEPTQGMHPITITAEDYATLINLFRSSNVFNLGAMPSIDFLDDYFASQSVYFTVDGIPYIALVSFDEETEQTTQTLLSIEGGLLYAQDREYVIGEESEGWTEWSQEALLDEITAITKTGTEDNVDTYTIYTKANPEGVATFTVTNGIDGLSAGFDTPIASASAQTLDAGSQASAVVNVSASGPNTNKKFGFSFTFGIPKGADGVVTAANGFVGFQIASSNGHLIMTYSGGTAPDIEIINDGDSPLDGHLVYNY